MESPRKASASACASSVSTRSAPAAKRSFSSSCGTFRLASGLRRLSATGTSCVLARMRVRPWRTVASASADAPTTRSQARMASACCVSMRTWFSREGTSAKRTKRQHRAALLREAHEVEHAGALAFQVRGHRDQRADRHHAGAADAGDQQVVGAGPRVRGGPGQGVDARQEVRRCADDSAPTPLRTLPPTTPTKLGQKPLAQE
jgi:hypothetical protein